MCGVGCWKRHKGESRINGRLNQPCLDGSFSSVHIIASIKHVARDAARMRQTFFRCLQRRQPGQECHKLTGHHCRGRRVQTRQAHWQNTLEPTSILEHSEPRSGHDHPLPRITNILADLNRHTSRVHLPLTSASAKSEFRRVVSRMLNAAMATEPTGPTTRSYLTPTGLKKIEPYWYPYTTMAKGRWLGREMLEVVSTEFRDRSIDYYVSLSHFCPNYPHDKHSHPHPEICSRIRSDNHQREDCQTRYHNPER